MLTLNHILLLILLSFPHGLPDHRFMLQFVLTVPLQDHEPSISSTISLPICEPLSISNYLIQKLANGAPTLHPFFSRSFCPPWGTHFTLGHLFLYLYIFPKLFHYFLYKHLYFTVIYLCRHRWRPAFLLATRNPCHPWLEHCLSFPPIDIVYRFRVLPRSFTIYPLNLFTLSRLWHNLTLVLSSP
jgi:hypothetical protein